MPSDFEASVLPQTPLGSLQRSPDPLTVLKRPTSKMREGGKTVEGEEEGEKRRGKGGAHPPNILA